MGKGTVLRVASDVALPPNLVNNLNILLNEPTLQQYDPKRNLADSYHKRADSLTAALHFILEAYPPNTGHEAFDDINLLKEYITSYRNNINFNNKPLNELQDTLSLFTGYLINFLMDGWHWTKDQEQKEAVACLNEAEQYVLMQKGTEDVATLQAMDFVGEKHYILQWDKRLPPYNDQWIVELKNIQAQNAPLTPPWFIALQPAEQVYLALSNNPQALKLNINDFYLKWLEQTQNTAQLQNELLKIKTNQEKSPWFLTLKANEQGMIVELLASQKTISIDEMTKSIFNFNEKASTINSTDVSKISALPLWYWLLSETQQQFLGHALKDASSIEEVVTFLPSRLRTLPAPANFRAHQLLILNAEGEIVEKYDQRLASSHIASRDVLKHPYSVQKLHTMTNLDAVLKFKEPGKPVIIQTLISPTPILNYLPQYFADVPPDYELAMTLKDAINSIPSKNEITHVNHPFNIAKRLYYTPSGEPGCLKLIDMAKAQFKDNKPYLRLAEKYERVLNSGFGSATLYDWNGRELFLSSYEHLLIVGLEGLSYGSCVSGKDRKSIEFIHTDAMLIYRKRYQCWPNIDDNQTERQHFVNIVVDLYVTRHAHELAGQNAPGSDGIKTPEHYWPGDISRAIKERFGSSSLSEDDRLATNNEIRRISSNLGKFIKPGNVLTRLVALRIGEKNCQGLIDGLGLVLNEKQHFFPEASRHHLFSSSNHEPRGIAEIRGLIKSHAESLTDAAENTNKSSSICIASRIFNIINQRPESRGNRSDATQTLYSLLRKVIKEPSSVDQVIEQLDRMKEQWYQSNRDSEMRRVSSAPDMVCPS